MNELNVYVVEESENQLRLDKVVCLYEEDLSRNVVQQLIECGEIKINDVAEKASFKVKTGDIITIQPREVIDYDVKAEDIPLQIVYEDEDLIVINKVQGMVVHPAVGHYSGTLVNALMFHCKDLSGINGVMRPGIVHRIDKDTSGLLVVAKNDAAHLSLAKQIKDKEAGRIYYALVYGVLPHDLGKIKTKIGRHPTKRKEMAVITTGEGKEAVTNFEVMERFADYTFVKCILETGRTHQIRVHLAYINHPIVGDPVYGPSKNLHPDGQLLHAVDLKLTHPRTMEKMEFHGDIPEYFQLILQNLRLTGKIGG